MDGGERRKKTIGREGESIGGDEMGIRDKEIRIREEKKEAISD